VDQGLTMDRRALKDLRDAYENVGTLLQAIELAIARGDEAQAAELREGLADARQRWPEVDSQTVEEAYAKGREIRERIKAG
jgi:hypothetical protein